MRQPSGLHGSRYRRSPASARLGLIALAVAALPTCLTSESLTLSAYYPSPLGAYAAMTTTGDTTLARDGGAVVVGSPAAAAGLTVNGTLSLNDGSGGLGKVLTSDATGQASWQTPTGGFANLKSFDANGSFIVPSGVTRVMVEAWGGGGGGGGGHWNPTNSGGGGGGAGAYAKGIFGVSANATYAITIGAGGGGGNACNGCDGVDGGDGRNSSFGALLTAAGGGGGTGGKSGQVGGMGPGGAASAPTAQIVSIAGASGGYGGYGYVGDMASGGAGGTAGGGGGAGGAANSASTPGASCVGHGVIPGGGGAGGEVYEDGVNARPGCAGAHGRVIVWY